jgi:hypothetical protein
MFLFAGQAFHCLMLVPSMAQTCNHNMLTF